MARRFTRGRAVAGRQTGGLAFIPLLLFAVRMGVAAARVGIAAARAVRGVSAVARVARGVSSVARVIKRAGGVARHASAIRSASKKTRLIARVANAVKNKRAKRVALQRMVVAGSRGKTRIMRTTPRRLRYARRIAEQARDEEPPREVEKRPGMPRWYRKRR